MFSFGFGSKEIPYLYTVAQDNWYANAPNSESASNCDPLQYNFLSSMQSLLLMKKGISQVEKIIMRI
uniref:Peptidase_M14 domain-containing protein n=1 Tax=Heterorhabditis bacteriophora TaxID=37862 RepID=A0A1I7W6T8_HETBA